MKRGWYYLKVPGKGRKSFCIIKERRENDKRIYAKVKDSRLTAINSDLKKGVPLNVCLKNARDLVEKLKKENAEPERKFLGENLHIVERYYEQEIEIRAIEASSKDSMRNSLLRAIEALGDLSLTTATRQEIQRAINKKFKGNRQRTAVARIRQLLKWIGRNDVRLVLEREDLPQVNYLNLEELEELLKELGPSATAFAVEIAAKAGLREGEVFGLDRRALNFEKRVFIGRQIKRDGRAAPPKWGKSRQAFLLPGARLAIEKWLHVSQDEKNRLMRDTHLLPEAVKKACRKLWPHEPEKHLDFHDLRNVYAIALGGLGFPDTLIAKFMGNSPGVVRKHYQGFLASEADFALAETLFLNSLRTPVEE